MNPSYLPVLKRICEEVRQDMASKSIKENEIEWNVNVEVLFFYAMLGHKPVGVNKHFMMLLTHNRFTTFLNHQLSSKALWDHLDTMYDMPSLHDCEIIPFPNEEVDFELPEECHDLLFSKYGVSLKDRNSEKTSKSSPSLKSSKKHGTPKFRQSSTPGTSTKSSTVSSTPGSSKAHKSHSAIKDDIKAPATYGGLKFKQDFNVTVKATKLKHSTLLYGGKYSKLESPSVIKDESSDISNKKKIEKGYGPTVSKKSLKGESATASSMSKKHMKSEGNGSGSKLFKTETATSSHKKVKDHTGKKGKVTPTVDNTYPNKKVENANFIKKKKESDGTPSLKLTKSDFKSPSYSYKGQELETPPSVGSKKSSVVKAKSESSKKSSRMKSEESVKRVAAADSVKKVGVSAKRRRL